MAVRIFRVAVMMYLYLHMIRMNVKQMTAVLTEILMKQYNNCIYVRSKDLSICFIYKHI